MPNKRNKISADKVWRYGRIAIIVALLIYFVPKIIGSEVSRHRINKNPAKTEALVQAIGGKVYRWGKPVPGRPVTFTYAVADTVYQCWVYLGKKEVSSLYIGKVVDLTYEKGNPTNAMYENALAEGETPIGHVMRITYTEIDFLADTTFERTWVKDSLILFKADS